MFKKLVSRTSIALIGISTLLLPFILSDCSVAVYPKAKMETAFNNVEKYLKENSTPTASGDVDFSSSTSDDAALAYFNANYTIEHFYRSIIFEKLYISLYTFSSTQRLDQYNKFYSQRGVTKVVEFSFGSTANSFEINIALTYEQKNDKNINMKCRESIYCLVRLENQKLYEKSVLSMRVDNELVSKREYDTEVTKNDAKFFYINRTPEEERPDEKDGLDVVFNYITPASDIYSPYPEIISQDLALGTVQENGRSMRRYIFLSPFD
jgi:hypothetical protein